MQNIYSCFISICLNKHKIRFASLSLANWFLTCLALVPEACCQQFSCLLPCQTIQSPWQILLFSHPVSYNFSPIPIPFSYSFGFCYTETERHKWVSVSFKRKRNFGRKEDFGRKCWFPLLFSASFDYTFSQLS